MTAVQSGNQPCRTDLTGASYAERGSQGTTVVVSAAANVNGVIIKMMGGSGRNATSTAVIRAGGQTLRVGASDSGAATNFLDKDVFVPAGLQIELVGTAGNYSLWMWYEVL